MSRIAVVAFYKFLNIESLNSKKDTLKSFCQDQGIKGTILLANEGINSTVAGPEAKILGLIALIKNILKIDHLDYKISYAEKLPFYRLKVMIKKEIVTLGKPVDVLKKVGKYVAPKDWNQLISQEDVLVLDTRNNYEIKAGTFERALNPQTESFSEFPSFVKNNLDPSLNKKIAMFCTGGIRCEKASSYLMQNGFEEVYHLEGGVLKYLEEIPPSKSLWKGECFVFDNRVTVKEAVEPGSFVSCGACRHPVSAEARLSPLYERGVSCPQCAQNLTPKQISKARERQKQLDLAKQRGTIHLGQIIP
ncbi:MAG: hypothetical protein JWM09_1301 [Francisellaceae bacterium]|nr:hypothetical protein [Francisellaceae bacterium]